MFCFTVTCYVRQQKNIEIYIIYVYIELCSRGCSSTRLLILVKIFLDLSHSIQFALFAIFRPISRFAKWKSGAERIEYAFPSFSRLCGA